MKISSVLKTNWGFACVYPVIKCFSNKYQLNIFQADTETYTVTECLRQKLQKNKTNIWIAQSYFCTDIGFLSDFAPSQLDVGFRKWLELRLIYIYQLLRDANFEIFCTMKRGIYASEPIFFQYLQLRVNKTWRMV